MINPGRGIPSPLLSITAFTHRVDSLGTSEFGISLRVREA
jgi:hypothetical protein